MTDRIPSDVAEARLNHLIDRARRGALLPAEADQFTTGLRDLVRQLEDTEDDRDRLQQTACRTAESLRHAEDRIARDEAAIERVRKLANLIALNSPWGRSTAQRFRDALDQPQRPNVNPAAAVEVRMPCPFCGDHQMVPRSQFVEHVARLHPEQQPTGAVYPEPRPLSDGQQPTT